MLDKALIPSEDAPKLSVVEQQALVVTDNVRVISFNNRPMYEVTEPFTHFIPLTRERFDRLAYNLLPGGPTRSRVGDLFALIANRADDLTDRSHLILFGIYDQLDDNARPLNHPNSIGPTVWDTRDLDTSTIAPADCVWRSPYAKIGVKQMFNNAPDYPDKIEFIMQLAGGDTGLYDDIMQSIAPMVMEKKPDGVCWWVGDGANGKSTLMDALYKIFPGQLSSLTLKSLTDQRDAPSLNGHLANIVKENSEGRIDDTDVYKSIGTHEDFSVHTFNKQDPTTIVGNMHHIFSGNSVPIFNDKGHSARRRTWIIPFRERFDSDPSFEEKTFTPEFFGRLVAEMCKYAVRIKRQGYQYKFSDITQGVKLDYDDEVNSAENYASHLLDIGVVAMDNFEPAEKDYPDWCVKNGFNALGIKQLRRELKAAGFVKDNKPGTKHGEKMWLLPNIKLDGLQPLTPLVTNFWRSKMFTLPGFTENVPEEPKVPAFREPDPNFKPASKLHGEW